MNELIIDLLPAFACFGAIYVIYLIQKGVEDKNKKSRQSKIKKLNIPKGKMSIYGTIGSNHLVLSNNDELYLINKNEQFYDKVKTSQVLDMKINIHVNERNVRRIISWTPTFDRKTKIEKIEFKITTERKTYTIYYTLGTITPKGRYNGSMEEMIDYMNRCKLLIENSKQNNCSI